MNTHRENRQQFYRALDGFWHDLYGTEYALWDVKPVTRDEAFRIREAAGCIGRIFDKTAPLLRQLDDGTLLQLGFPQESLRFIRLSPLSVESVIARLDLVVAGGDIKLLELNADTPTFIKETFFINGKVCEAFGLDDLNEACEQALAEAVQQAVQSAFQSLGKQKVPNIVFASHGDHEEDRLTTMYLQKLYGRHSQYMSLDQLRLVNEPVVENGKAVAERGLYDQNGQKIDVLYRQTYPIEHLVNDEEPHTKEKVGQWLMQLVEEKELAVLNPPSAFLLQSKAVMALIWGLHEEKHPFYTEEEHSWIHTYFLPTYLDEEIFVKQGIDYVKKPSFGREGDTVEIYEATGRKIDEDVHKTYEEALPVYQQFIELPETAVVTEHGEKNVRYMYGCFYVNGRASAIGIRAGRQITDNESYFLPAGMDKEEEQ
jgi:glutathionylspermidine synthase